MTFVLAWKHAKHVYLCADSAVTYPSLPPDSDLTTAFGENSGDSTNSLVDERAMKLVNLGQAIVGLCGDYSIARRVLLALRDELIHQPPKEAFSAALRDYEPQDDLRKIKLVIAWPQGTEAVACGYNADGGGRIEDLESDHAFRLSGTSMHRELTIEAIAKVTKSAATPAQQLACILSLLQSYGVNRNYLQEGIGGAYCGAVVTPSEIKWQGDIMYIITQPGQYLTHAITTRIRDNVLTVQTTIGSRTKVMAELLSSGPLDDWLSEHKFEIEGVMSDYSFDFVSFLTAGYPICTVVEMNGAEKSADLRMPKVVAVLGSDELQMELEMSARVREATVQPSIAEDSGTVRPKLTFFEFAPHQCEMTVR
ncbi:hypothetical protein [Lacipirellula sp.]|uniref:hypothetical protein n=1 Tax=Lacipirellula sp. TaxID=2691419 RepID=UPI003D0E56F9